MKGGGLVVEGIVMAELRRGSNGGGSAGAGCFDGRIYLSRGGRRRSGHFR